MSRYLGSLLVVLTLGACVSNDRATLASSPTTIAALDRQLDAQPENISIAVRLGDAMVAEYADGNGSKANDLAALRRARTAINLQMTNDFTHSDPDNRWVIARSKSRDAYDRRLFEMVYRDQQVQQLDFDAPDHLIDALMPYLKAQMEAQFRVNIAELKTILPQVGGWFDISRYGAAASQAAWLIVQHADFDPAFQREILTTLQPRTLTGDMQPKYYAYLVDRVRVNAGEPQLYATQGSCVTGQGWRPKPTEDLERVDLRRASVGLAPLEEYRGRFTCNE